MAYLEEVYCLSGVPTVTFVEPQRYAEIKVSVRTPGRCIVVEGPSGIGKTTTIEKVIEELKLEIPVTTLSARKQDDLEYIAALPGIADAGIVIVDDFHRLSDGVKSQLSDHMKVLADTGSNSSKLILIGINKAGQQLVKFAHDLGMRVDVFRLEANAEDRILELIGKGEGALNIDLDAKQDIVKSAHGSFQLAQMLCHRLCVLGGVTETRQVRCNISLPLDVVIEEAMTDLSRQFQETALLFARGSKLRREGRAPYLHILRWLAESTDWSLDLREAVREHPEHRSSIGQVLDKGYLQALLNDKSDLFDPYFHYEPSTCVVSVEDPKLLFYLKNLVWRAFTKKVGFPASLFAARYDFALSFAGAERDVAQRLFEILSEREVSVFYDENEQHRILAENLEEYLGPIYRRDAHYVLPLLSPAYPSRIWTKFESDNFRQRFGENAVIPIRYITAQPGYFSDERRYGGLSFDPNQDLEIQLQSIAETLCRRLVEDRQQDETRVVEEFLGDETEAT